MRFVRTTAAAVTVLLAATACSSGQDVKDSRQGQTGFVSGSGRVSSFAPADREKAPDFGGTTLDGKKWNSTDAAGKVTVINVWGSWCGPCREEAPDLSDAAKELGASVQFIGLNVRDLDPAPPLKFVEAFGVTYPSVYDPSGKLLLKFRGQISPSSIPSTLVLDKQGRVASRVLGPLTKQTLLGMVKDAS
ncbi:TlpA disulfide reductase family protein [Streptomyces sp. SID13031]|uniref:TlpA family protein disulfide reductase n=1 Tax=Streptomyces sp. SID13031 TaxID=2706046 RepID=UPI0013CA1A32|nr:TlpA disulfide reductase family protein [Streptomyces sp. SID13031]NEA36321.1 TlpA family protein disulfide reductase [Streptomyces sp. SID13031]